MTSRAQSLLFFAIAVGRLRLAYRQRGVRGALGLIFARFPFHRSRLVRVSADLRRVDSWRPDRPGLHVRRGTLQDLEAFRARADLPFQFHLDRLAGLKRFYLGYVDGQVAGILWICVPPARSPHIRLGPTEAEAQESFILPPFRRRGLYLALFAQAMRELAEEGIERLYSHTDFENEASLAGKTKLGFSRLGVLHVVWILGIRTTVFVPRPESAAPPPRETGPRIVRDAQPPVRVAPALRVTPITGADEWNRLVCAFPGNDVRQSYGWGEMRRSMGWTPYRYAIFDGDTCLAALSVEARRIPGRKTSVLYASRGPLMNWKDPAAWRGLLIAIDDIRRQTNAVFLRVSPGLTNDQAAQRDAFLEHHFRALPDDWTIWNTPRIILTLDVTRPERALYAGLRARFRQYVAAAERRGLHVRTADNEGDLYAFHLLMREMGKQKGYPVRDLQYFEAVKRNLLVGDDGVLLLVESGSRIMGGLLGVKFDSRAYLLYSCTDRRTPTARFHQGPALHWRFVQWAKSVGCSTVDLGGSGTRYPPDEADPGFGVYHFKCGLGAELGQMIGYFDLVFRPTLYTAFRLAEQHLLPRFWTMRARYWQ